MNRIVVAIDPTATSNADSNEAGITVEGCGLDHRGYVLEDLSIRGTPREWAAVAVDAYHRWQADRIIAETHNGGEMVEAVIWKTRCAITTPKTAKYSTDRMDSVLWSFTKLFIDGPGTATVSSLPL